MARRKRKPLHLVTGASGFCGSFVVRELLARGDRVVGTDLPGPLSDPKHREVLRSTGLDLDHPALEIVPADLLDEESVRGLFDRPITHVFHTASLYDYSAPLERLRRINVGGTDNLLAAVADADLERFVHWSTCGVFGKPYTAAHGDKVNIPFTEESPSPRNTPFGQEQPDGTHLVNAYSVSKWEQEQRVWRAHREQGLPVTVVRPAPMYGPGSAYGHGGIILAIAQGLMRALPLDAKNYITTSVHVLDMARFALFVADRPETLGEDYNVVDNSVISYYEFLEYIALLTGRRMRTLRFVKLERVRPVFEAAATAWTWLSEHLGIPRVRVFEAQSAGYVSSSYWLDNRKSLAAGFDYRYPDVKEGLKDTIAWFRTMGWLTDRSYLMTTGAATKPA